MPGSFLLDQSQGKVATSYTVSLDLQKALNHEQYLAASTLEGPLLIIAGAGSGKTRMITYRIANMLEKGIPEESILALTFTNKAAKEMRERAAGLTGKILKGLTATTFHSFGLGLLKQYIHHLGYHNDFTVYDTGDNEALLKNCIQACGYGLDDYNVRTLLSTFSKVKTGREALFDQDSAASQIYKEWLLTQKAYNVVDFDDLIVLPIKLFETHQWILEKVQERYRYIMVDEFQDTSLLQYRFISMIAKKHRNIAVVGDDDQSIYSWRGANYQNIVEFEKDFPELKEFKLERNYRSTGNILSAANSVIAHNAERKEKKLWTEEGTGAAISMMCHKNTAEEAGFIALDIKRSMREMPGLRFSDIGILVRTNSLMGEIENTLTEMNLPVQVSGGKSFFDRKEIRDILSYLKVLVNDRDDTSLLRIINTPRRGIGRIAVEKLRKTADDEHISLYEAMQRSTGVDSSLSERSRESVKRFLQLLESFKAEASRNPSGLIMRIVKETGYEDMIKEEFPDSEKAQNFKLNGLRILSERLQRYLRENPDATMKDYLTAVTMAGDEKEDDLSRINLMTIHASKGLEFRLVHLAGINDDLIPSKRALEENPESLEEERRLFYVAITRAKEKLVINYPQHRPTHEGDLKLVNPSRFISEIPQELFKSAARTEEEKKKEQLAALAAFKKRFKAH